MKRPEKLFPALPEILRHDNDTGGSVLAAVATDLDIDGAYAQEWIVVTEERLRIYSSKQHPAGRPSAALQHTLRFDEPLALVKSPRAVSFIIGGALRATLGGKTVELLRYTNNRRQAISRLANYLDAVSNARARGEKVEAVPVWEEEKAEQRNCARCGLPIPGEQTACPACSKKTRTIWRLFRYLKPFRKQTFFLIVSLLGGTALALVTPYFTRPLMDVVLAPVGQPMPFEQRALWLFLIVLGMLGTQIVGLLLTIAQSRVASSLSQRLAHSLRVELYQHLQRLSLRFFDKRSVGALMTRVTQDTKELESVLTLGAQFFAVNFLTLIGIIVVLCLLNWRLFLYVMVVIPGVVFLSRTFWQSLSPMWSRAWHHRSRLSATLNDNLSGVRVVKAFAQEQREVERFRQRSHELAMTGMRVEQTWMTMLPVLSFVTGLGALVVWLVGGRQVLNGTLTLGVLLSFIAYLGLFYSPLQSLNRMADLLGRALAATERVFEILDNTPDVVESPNPVSLPCMEGRVEFRNVTFGHDPYLPVLHNINLTVAAGEMIGIVGHSGAGKSTMINLLCRFYDVDAGQILIDGIDVRQIRQAELRSQLGLVLQETFLFNDTLAENIRYGKPDATPEEIIAVAKSANAHHFIARKPDGYDTMAGERGVALSGGERQRISIARSLLHDPHILILDEATSAMDTKTERQIQDALARLTQGRTTFAIAHRLSTLRHATRLVVLKEGRIEEIGTYDELMERRGEFYRLVEAQQTLSKFKVV